MRLPPGFEIALGDPGSTTSPPCGAMAFLCRFGRGVNLSQVENWNQATRVRSESDLFAAPSLEVGRAGTQFADVSTAISFRCAESGRRSAAGGGGNVAEQAFAIVGLYASKGRARLRPGREQGQSRGSLNHYKRVSDSRSVKTITVR